VQRQQADIRWRARIGQLDAAGKDVDADFFKAWLRSQYASKIRERRKGAHPEDFDRIGTEYHRWLRDAGSAIGLPAGTGDFQGFINRDFDFYSAWYLRLIAASNAPVDGLEHVLYNAQNGFTLQYMLLLAPLTTTDSDTQALRKVDLVARYVDILLARRIWNSRSIAYSTMQYAMFLVMREIRGLDLDALGKHLHAKLAEDGETFATNDRPRVHQQNRHAIHRLLARMTDYVESRSGQASHYAEYVNMGKVRYEVEHVWADHPERHADEFTHPADFAEHRNRLGGLLLLPKSFNASYNDLPYEDKLPEYLTQNLLAQSLHPQCYGHNPGFVGLMQSTGLPFRPYDHFTKADLEERTELYRRLAQVVWDPQDLLRYAAN
jgi:hypothetical protein